MTLTFVSNYINHHQIPVSNELYKSLGESYHFVQVMPMEEERAGMGWSVNRDELPYLLCYYEEPERCRLLIEKSDIVVFGGVEEESYIQNRLSLGKLTIRYSERLYREGQWKAISPRGLIRKYKDHFRYRKKNVYLLCSGAYTASDFSIIKSYPGKMYKWGYFPEFIPKDKETLFSGKKEPCEILFAARFIPLKHPEYPIKLAEHLQKNNIPFHLTMIGDGDMRPALEREVASKGLGAMVDFKGFLPPKTVREYMDRAHIFLMTSNHLEGWGAVIPEAMNSGCAVLASSLIGAVPFLLRHNRNGLVYREGNINEFLSYGEALAKGSGLRNRLALSSYETIESEWNPQFAAQSLITFSQGLLKGEIKVNESGPLSPAPILFPSKGYSYVRE